MTSTWNVSGYDHQLHKPCTKRILSYKTTIIINPVRLAPQYICNSLLSWRVPCSPLFCSFDCFFSDHQLHVLKDRRRADCNTSACRHQPPQHTARLPASPSYYLPLQQVSASEITYSVSGGALNSTHSLQQVSTEVDQHTPRKGGARKKTKRPV